MVRPARCIGVSSVANQTRHRACTSGSRRSLVIARQIIVFWPAEPARSADHRAHGSLCRAFAGSVQGLPAMIARGSTRLFERASNLCANGTRDERFALRESRACRLANGKRGEGGSFIPVPNQCKYIGCNPGKHSDTRKMATASDEGSRDIEHDRYLCIAVWLCERPRSYERRDRCRAHRPFQYSITETFRRMRRPRQTSACCISSLNPSWSEIASALTSAADAAASALAFSRCHAPKQAALAAARHIDLRQRESRRGNRSRNSESGHGMEKD